MVRIPDDIVWIGSVNQTEGRGGSQPAAIVNHIMQGSLTACDNWFNNPTSRVSAHFGVGRNGEIHQYVSSWNTAWANGVVNRPDTGIPWLANAVQQRINPNRLTISIEHEGFSGEPMSEAQYQSSLALHRYFIQRYGIPLESGRFIGHFRIDRVNKAGCPGRGYPWQRLFADLGVPAARGEESTDAQEDAPRDMPTELSFHTNEQGEGLESGDEAARQQLAKDAQGVG